MVRISFGDPLRSGLRQVTGQELKKKEKCHPRERDALIYVGEKGRERNRNHWVLRLLKEAEYNLHLAEEEDKALIVLVDDVYHWNEAISMDYLIALYSEEAAEQYRDEDDTPLSQRETRQILDAMADEVFLGTRYAIYDTETPQETMSLFQDIYEDVVLSIVKDFERAD